MNIRQIAKINKTFKRALCILILIMPKIASAQLELYTKASEDGSIEPIINYNGSTALNEKLSVTFFGLVRKSWSQALIGISYSPTNNFSFSSSMGIEHGKSSPRYAASIWMKRNQTTLLLLGEHGSGADNYLYKVNLFYGFTDQFTFGATAWRYHGFGPNFRLLIPKLESTIWVLPAYDFEFKQSRVMLGISFKM